jgi:haloacetate dehalogenase
MTDALPGFDHRTETLNGARVAWSQAGSGPAVLLLHGFPQTRAMWRGIAPGLAERFTVIAPDLRGYGDSETPQDMADMSFRAMAADAAALMAHLGHERFHLVGHDRGGRTAHRLALDRPEIVRSLTVMDIVPTHLLLSQLEHGVARSYYHWFFLSQPSPLPERMIGADPDAFFESCLLGWGGASLTDFDAAALDAYRESWRRPATIASMCNDYRAAIDVDFADDAADLGRRVSCPALVLYGADGKMAQAFDVPATWADRLADMRARTAPGGHFFPDTAPDETAGILLEFLTGFD